MLSFLLGKYLGVERPDHTECVCLTFKKLLNSSIASVAFNIATSTAGQSQLLHILNTRYGQVLFFKLQPF